MYPATWTNPLTRSFCGSAISTPPPNRAANRVWVCVSNERCVERPVDGAAGTWRFATTPQVSPYMTAVVAVRNYPANTDIVVRYVYDNPAPLNVGGPDITDARAVSVTLSPYTNEPDRI